MKDEIRRLVHASLEAPAGTFVVVADASRPRRFVQWIQLGAGLVQVEMPRPIEEHASAAAASLGYLEDVPNLAQELSCREPERLIGLVMETIDVLGGITTEAVDVTFQRGEPLKVDEPAPDAEANAQRSRDAEAASPAICPEPALLCFRRPDGRTGWAIARDPADYVRRLEAGEYGSRTVPTNSTLAVVVPVDDLAGSPLLRELLNRDRDLAAAAAGVLEGRPPPDDNSPAAQILREMSSGRVRWKRVSNAVAELLEQRRAVSPRRARKSPTVSLTARFGPVVATGVVEVGFSVKAVARAGSTTWLCGSGTTGPVVACLRGTEVETWDLAERPMWMRRGPDDRAAAVSFRGVAIAQSDTAPIFVEAPADIRDVAASRLGLVAALRDHTLVCWSWDGAMRWRTAPIDALQLRLAMSDSDIVVLSDGRLLFVENDGQLLRPAPRPPREDAWDSGDVSAVGVRANRIYAAMGSACATLDVEPAFRWSPRIASDDFLATVLSDVSGQLVGFAGRSSATIFGIDGAAQTIDHGTSGLWCRTAKHCAVALADADTWAYEVVRRRSGHHRTADARRDASVRTERSRGHRRRVV